MRVGMDKETSLKSQSVERNSIKKIVCSLHLCRVAEPMLLAIAYHF